MSAATTVPAVSILMPVRNAAPYLDEAIASLIGQSFGDFELIAIDNGSTDATPDLLARWAELDPRLRVDQLGRARLSGCLNHAAALARAPLLARLDADDVAEPDRLRAQVAAFAANPGLGLVGSAATLIDPAGRKLGELHPPTDDAELRRRQQASSGFVTSTTMVRKALFERVGGYRQGLNISEDFDLWVRISEHCEIANLPDLLISYRVHPRSATARQPAQMAIASLCITAAAEARRRGLPEPFSRGVPNLRQALPLLGISRRHARRTVRLRSAANRFLRRASSLPIPAAVKTVTPRLARWLGIRTIYDRYLRSAHLAARRRRR
jgi:glycosyltransferase involved in cell wall biosynthesis